MKTLIAIAAVCLPLAACTTPTEIGKAGVGPMASQAVFGDAVRQNIAAQTVNPQASTADVTASGNRVAKAVTAYQADKVEKPRAPGTLSIQSGGAPGGGGGGGGGGSPPAGN